MLAPGWESKLENLVQAQIEFRGENLADALTLTALRMTLSRRASWRFIGANWRSRFRLTGRSEGRIRAAVQCHNFELDCYRRHICFETVWAQKWAESLFGVFLDLFDTPKTIVADLETLHAMRLQTVGHESGP